VATLLAGSTAAWHAQCAFSAGLTDSRELEQLGMAFMAWHLLEHCGSDLIHVSGCRYNHLALGGWLRVIDVRHGVAAAGDTAALQYAKP
jgi:hypothetical protein